MTSKEMFAQIMGNVNEFEAVGQDWCDNDTVVSAARARSYSKKIISGLRAFVDMSLAEEIELARLAAIAAAEAEAAAQNESTPEPVVEEPQG